MHTVKLCVLSYDGEKAMVGEFIIWRRGKCGRISDTPGPASHGVSQNGFSDLSWKFTKGWWWVWSHLYETLNYCFTKTQKGINQRAAEEPCWYWMNTLNAFLLCSSMCSFDHAETRIRMKCHTPLPFQPAVQFIFLSSDGVHKFNNCLLSWSLYSLSASYSVFSLCRLAGNASF